MQPLETEGFQFPKRGSVNTRDGRKRSGESIKPSQTARDPELADGKYDANCAGKENKLEGKRGWRKANAISRIVSKPATNARAFEARRRDSMTTKAVAAERVKAPRTRCGRL